MQLRVVRTNNHGCKSKQKAVIIKQPGQLFWWPQSTCWKPRGGWKLVTSDAHGIAISATWMTWSYRLPLRPIVKYEIDFHNGTFACLEWKLAQWIRQAQPFFFSSKKCECTVFWNHLFWLLTVTLLGLIKVIFVSYIPQRLTTNTLFPWQWHHPL